MGAALTSDGNLLSQAIAPPAKADPYIEAALETLGWLICICLGILLIPLAIGIPLIAQGRRARRKAKAFNEDEWPALYEKWGQGWICMTCGVVWEPDKPIPPVSSGMHSNAIASPLMTPLTHTEAPPRKTNMTLHHAIEEVLLEAGRPMTTTELAVEINTRGSYSKRDGSPITPFQIHGRTRNYPTWFTRDGSTVSLAQWQQDPTRTPRKSPSSEAPVVTSTATAISTIEVDDLDRALLSPDAFRLAGTIDSDVPDQPGLYAIRLLSQATLPEPFASLIEQRGNNLLYVGIARGSLRRRLLGQELRARGHGTFFRTIGAVLGYRPPSGSLLGKGNTRNYKFIPDDERAIIAWMNANLLVNWVEVSVNVETAELALIRKHLPLLNLRGNPAALPELSTLRAECVRIANTPA